MTRWLAEFFGEPMRGRKRADKPMDGRGSGNVRILKRGAAMRVIFFYPGEEGTYMDNAYVTLYDNGIVHIKSSHEESTTHLQNCEIIWRYGADAEERTPKVRLLKPKSNASREGEQSTSEENSDSKSSKTPDLS